MSAEEASRKEIELIAQYDSTNPEKGYNCSLGGFGINSETLCHMWQDDEFKKYVSGQMREAWKDPEKRKRRSELTKERWQNDEFKESVREKIKQVCGTSVKCVETGKTYINICDAEKELNIPHSNILRSIRTGYRCGGYHWQKVDSVL